MTITTNPAKGRRLAEQSIDSDLQADAYEKLAAYAATLGLEYEVDRAKRAVREFQVDAEDLRCQALAAGFDPDEF